MTSLAIASFLFFFIHIGISATALRDKFVARIGDKAYMAIFSIASIVLIAWLVRSYNTVSAGDVALTWGHQEWARHLLWLLMAISSFLVVVGITTPNPTSVQQEKRLEETATGIVRITRHPFLWGVGLWALGHFIVNGDQASTLFFGTFALTAFGGTLSIDAKRKRNYPNQWPTFLAKTSNVPFVAIMQKRNTLQLGELGWWRIALAVIVYFGFLHGHAMLFSVSAL